MYSYVWDETTNGLLLNSTPLSFSKEPRPVYYQELDILGFDKHWDYEKNDSYPYMWAEANNYWYCGRKVAQTKGGSLYTAPELLLLDSPEPDGVSLRFVDVPAMVEKNRGIMDNLVQDTVKKVFNNYIEYKDNVDLFYVAFSGGKDSIVVLDIVQRALPHNEFKVVFGDTDMEFPSTMDLVDEIRQYCKSKGILFYEAKADLSSAESWRLFGPPARRLRWCCSVHKTAPVINKLSDLYGKKRLRSVMITGVRADESASRSDYDEFSIGKKLNGQFSYHPILEWSSAEVYLYTYMTKLPFNILYKYGFNRVGCIMCPNSSEKHEFIKRKMFEREVEDYCNLIVDTSRKDLSGTNRTLFLETGGWKTRFSGRELKLREEERYAFQETEKELFFVVKNLNPDWRTWYKTLGDMVDTHPDYLLEFSGVWRKCRLENDEDESIFIFENSGRNKNTIEFLYLFKNLLTKSQYCIQCKACVAVCPHRYIEMDNGKVYISDNCVKCHACLKVINGCLYYNSIRGSKSVKNLKGINKYLSLGIDAVWIKKYMLDDTFEPGNRKTDVMYGFMTDAGITSKRKITSFGEFVKEKQLDDVNIWALMLCNLVYTPAFKWYVRNIPFDDYYIEKMLDLDLGDEVTTKAKGEFWNAFKTILLTNEAFQRIGLGIPDVTEKQFKTGDTKKSLNSIIRKTWHDPDPRVILYSIYKFAENCGDYYSFTLTRLLNHDINSDGVSPTEIFGIGKDKMQKILSGLSINYPEFINASFTHDLDNITLYSNMTSTDVLNLF